MNEDRNLKWKWILNVFDYVVINILWSSFRFSYIIHRRNRLRRCCRLILNRRWNGEFSLFIRSLKRKCFSSFVFSWPERFSRSANDYFWLFHNWWNALNRTSLSIAMIRPHCLCVQTISFRNQIFFTYSFDCCTFIEFVLATFFYFKNCVTDLLDDGQDKTRHDPRKEMNSSVIYIRWTH